MFSALILKKLTNSSHISRAMRYARCYLATWLLDNMVVYLVLVAYCLVLDTSYLAPCNTLHPVYDDINDASKPI